MSKTIWSDAEAQLRPIMSNGLIDLPSNSKFSVKDLNYNFDKIINVNNALNNLNAVNEHMANTHIHMSIDDIPQSDWNQTNNTAKDYIKNRPFYEDTTTSEVNITWDGNTEGLIASSKGRYYKVSDQVFTYDEFKNMSFTYNGTVYAINGEVNQGEEEGILTYYDWGPVIATRDNAGGIPGGASDIFPSKGVYFHADGSITQLTGNITTGTVKKIDKKFLDLSDYATTDLTNIDNTIFKAKVEASGFSSGSQVQILTWEATD